VLLDFEGAFGLDDRNRALRLQDQHRTFVRNGKRLA
jgi:hypothetical protein